MSEGATVSVDKKVDEILNTVKKLPGYVFELSADLGCGRNFSIRGNFDPGESVENMHAEMDKLVRVCDRQLSKAVIPAIEKKVREEKFTLDNFERNLGTILKQQSGHKSLPAVAEANRDNAQANVDRQRMVVAEQEALLERTKADAA